MIGAISSYAKAIIDDMYQQSKYKSVSARVIVAAAASLVMAACASAPRHSVPVIGENAYIYKSYVATRVSTGTSLTVMTLNMAHARSNGFHQALQGWNRAIDNLDDIIAVVDEANPDILALQEADGSSIWSGSFDHVAYLATEQGYRHWLRGEHVAAAGLHYGTALVSRVKLNDPESLRFASSFGSLPKGFVVSTIRWPGSPWIEVDVVSVHLDPLSKKRRMAQVGELTDMLKSRGRPVIVMGDMNTEWVKAESALHKLSADLGVAVFEPNADLVTYPRLGKRLDWIMISDELDFAEHQIVGDGISDHRGVVAVLDLNTEYLRERNLLTRMHLPIDAPLLQP